MKKPYLLFLVLLGWLGVAGIARGQSQVVGVRLHYTGGLSNGGLNVGDPINLAITGASEQSDSTQIEMVLDAPVLMTVSAANLSSYDISFTPPAGFVMVIERVRTNVFSGTFSPSGPVSVTLARRETAAAANIPTGAPSSIQWVAVTSAPAPRWPYLAFNLGAAKNGEALPMLRIPLTKRVNLFNAFVPPDAEDIAGYTKTSTDLQFSVPQADVTVTSVGSADDFDLTFCTPGTSTAFATYHFQIITWQGDGLFDLKKIKVIKNVPGAAAYETTISGAFTEAGITVTGVPWTVEDWHSGASPLRVVTGTRTSATTGVTIVDGEWRVTSIVTETIDVMPTAGSSTIASKTINKYNASTMGPAPYYHLVFPLETTTGVGDGNYLTETHMNPNFPTMRATKSPEGAMRIEQRPEGVGQTRTVYEPWRAVSPIFYDTTPLSPTTTGTLKTETTYAQGAPWGAFEWPNSIIKTLGASTLAKTMFSYAVDTINSNVVVATRTDYADASNTLTHQTITKRYRPDLGTADAALRSRPFSIQSPTGAKQSYAYTAGSYSGTNWIADFRVTTLSGATTGGATISQVDGVAVDPLQMHANRSTKTVEYLQRGRLVRRETWIYVSGTGGIPTFNSTTDPVTWETFQYTADGRLQVRTNSAGAIYTAAWIGTQKTSETDETGLSTTFGYDAMDRVTLIARSAATNVAAQQTNFEYDAENRVRFQRVGPTGGEQLTTETVYDKGGRIKQVKQPGQGTTSVAGTIITGYTLTNGGRDVLTTYNVGTALTATRSVVRFVDGRVQDVTGTAVVEEHYDYDLDASYRPRTTRKLGPANKRPSITVFDLMGRPVEERSDGFGATGAAKPLVTFREYNAQGLPSKVFSVENPGTTGIPITGVTLMFYDEFGELKTSGLDLSTGNDSTPNGALDTASKDRFTETTRSFVNQNGAWWLRVSTRSYYADGSNAYHEAYSDTRLTGLTGMVSQVISSDFDLNLTTQTVVLDSAAGHHTRRARTKLPDGTTTEVATVGSIKVAEQAFSSSDPNLTGTPVLATGFTYDALGRQTYVTDSRKGSAQTNYWFGTALPREQYDARAVLVASYAYDAAGRRSSTTATNSTANSIYTTVSTTYTPRGEVLLESGTGTHPSLRSYTAFGELESLKTYRDRLTVTADTTSWTYDDNTGLLTYKYDATNAFERYAYSYADGYRDVIRYSARASTTPMKTRYSLSTGDLMKIDYGDSTPDVDFQAYDREGHLKTIQDATGVRSLTYENGRPKKEALSSWFNSLVLTSDYQTATSIVNRTVANRYYKTMLGSATDADLEMSVAYGYDDFGRVNGVTADYKAIPGTRSALNVPASYTYETKSSMWKGLSQGNFSETRVFEINRDVLTSISANHTTAGPVATFGYGTDDSGRREWMTQSGMAFGDFVDTSADATYYQFKYEGTANELTSAIGYRGITPSQTTSPLPGRGFTYTYDDAGNRMTGGVAGNVASYRQGEAVTDAPGANALNQTRSRDSLKVRVSGTSDKTVSVTVAGNTTTRETSAGRYWDYAWPYASPSTSGQFTSATVAGTVSGQTPQTGSVSILAKPQLEVLKYDADGNLTEDALWMYEWDAENRLTHMYTKSTAVTWGAPNRDLKFTYDYLGRRVRKESKLNNNLVSDTKFIYDDWLLLAELDTATNRIVRSYAWGLDIDSSMGGTGGVGGLVLETLHSTTALKAYHVSYDGGGNVAALVNQATGAIAASYEYGPFGENVRTQVFDATLVAQGQPIRYSTKYTDSESGLIYYGRRYYDPTQGRFIGRDPIGEKGGNNLYGFVGNAPVNGYDYLGMEGSAVYLDNQRLGDVDFSQVEELQSLSQKLASGSSPVEVGRRLVKQTDSWNAYQLDMRTVSITLTLTPNSSDADSGRNGSTDSGAPGASSSREKLVAPTGEDYFGAAIPGAISNGTVTFSVSYKAVLAPSNQVVRYLFTETSPVGYGGLTTITANVSKAGQKLNVAFKIVLYFSSDSYAKSGVPLYSQYAEYQHLRDYTKAIEDLFPVIANGFAKGGSFNSAPEFNFTIVRAALEGANKETVRRYDKPDSAGNLGQHDLNGVVLRPSDFNGLPGSWW
jgi:RHS repeat-associated protein